MPVLDPFGKREIYPTNSHPNRGKPWFLGIGDWNFRLFTGWNDWSHYETSYDDGLVIEYDDDDAKGRFPVLALHLIDYGFSVVRYTDQRDLKKRGYMDNKSDWKNVEVTLYWKPVTEQYTGQGIVSLCARGGPHHPREGVGPPQSCTGTCYLAALGVNGVPSISKELEHPKYAWGTGGATILEEGEKDLIGKWVGMKGIFYTKANGNPRIEVWIDRKADNNWGEDLLSNLKTTEKICLLILD